MSEKRRGITLNYAVDPEAVCCGVMVEDGDGKRLVQVTPKEEYVVPDSNASLWEYVDEAGLVRACLLRVKEGQYGPIWEINQDAGQDVSTPYYEVHQTIAGTGTLAVSHGSGEEVDSPVAYYSLPIINKLGGVSVNAGQSFAVDAERWHGDAWVLATFPGAPFRSEYETRLF